MIRVLKDLSETKLTRSDLAFFTLRITLACCFLGRFGFFYGTIAIIALNLVLEWLVITLYKVEPLNTTDQNLFYD